MLKVGGRERYRKRERERERKRKRRKHLKEEVEDWRHLEMVNRSDLLSLIASRHLIVAHENKSRHVRD